MAQSMVLTREDKLQAEKPQKAEPRKTGVQRTEVQSVIMREVRTQDTAPENHVETNRPAGTDRRGADGTKSAATCVQENGNRTAVSRQQDGVQAVVLRPADDHMQEVVIRPQDGYFIRDLARDEVICPAGNILHRKCTKSNGYTRYMSKASCSRCEAFRKCYSGKRKWKEIDFSDGALVVRCRNWTKEE